MKPREINILMYHSISDGAGPTCIPPRLFREHMNILAECQYQAIPLMDLPVWIQNKRDLPLRAVVITFDDGFADFATTAFPDLQARSWPATIFLPVEKMSRTNDWEEPRNGATPLPIMSWEIAARLGLHGIELGAHAMNHTDLTRLSPEAARDEIVNSKRLLESATGCSVTSFAPPYGRTNASLRAEISRHYEVAVGTRLGRARRSSDIYNLPRIEMHYFRNLHHWHEFLEKGSTIYFGIRRALRALRSFPRSDERGSIAC